jgi:hypothetical protein
MVKLNVVRMAVLATLTLGSTLPLSAGSAQAQDLRAPMVRSDGPTDLSGHAQNRIAQARGGAGHRRETAQQRSSAMERRETPKPAQMKRAEQPQRERGEVTKAGNGTPRSR